ncbi:MAG: hypothetical protein Kow0031_24560 [Anaerolineae bacterium]
MPVTTATQTTDGIQRVFTTRNGGVDLKLLKEELAARAAAGQVTTRDESILEYLRELHVMSLEQIFELFWPDAKNPLTARNRLSTLIQYKLVSYARRVPAAEMRTAGLEPGSVYALGVGGWLWLRENVNHSIMNRVLKREQVLHDLLVGQVCLKTMAAVQARGEAWQMTWAGEEAAAYYELHARDSDKAPPPVIAPDGLAVIRRRMSEQMAVMSLFIEMDNGREAHGRPSSDWGRKIQRYNEFMADKWRLHPQLADLPDFPAVAVITHGAQRLLNLAHAIQQYRKEPISYHLALWEDLVGADDILSAPAWLVLTADGKVIGQERRERRGFLPPVAR